MKKIVTFEKELDFPSMIGEINTISLDQNIKFENSSFASGELIVSGKYKITEASTLLEDFKYNIPVEITLTEAIDLDSSSISINDFNYEIVNEDILKCKIDILVEGIEIIEIEEEPKENLEQLVRECDGDAQEAEIEEIVEQENIEKLDLLEEKSDDVGEMKKEQIKDNIDEVEEIAEESKISTLFQAFENSEETFTTYSVYIMRKEDTLEKILDKYKVSLDAISEYNDIDNLEVGTKIIIPSNNG